MLRDSPIRHFTITKSNAIPYRELMRELAQNHCRLVEIRARHESAPDGRRLIRGLCPSLTAWAGLVVLRKGLLRLSHRWDSSPVRLRRRKACLPLPKPMLVSYPLHFGVGAPSMEIFRAVKIATVDDQSNYNCRFCAGKLTLVRTIMESESGVVIHMFECLQCGDCTWKA